MSANNDKKKKTGKSTDKAAKTPGIAPTLVFAVLTAVVMHIFVWSVFVVLYTFTGHTKSCEALHITVCLLAVLVYFIIRSNLIYLGKVRTAGFFFGFHISFLTLLCGELGGFGIMSEIERLMLEPGFTFAPGRSYDIALYVFLLCYLALLAVDFIMLIYELYGKKSGHADFSTFEAFSEDV